MRTRERIPLHDHSDGDSGGIVASSTIVGMAPGGSTTPPPAASAVPIADIGDYFLGANVEDALAELAIRASGAGVLYFDDDASDIGGYQTLSFTPDTATAEEEDTVSVAAADGALLIESYATAAGVPGMTVIPSGTWEFHSFRRVSNASGTTQLLWQVYTRAAGGTETLLFTATSADINDTSVNAEAAITISTQPDFVIDPTDRLVVKVLAQTTSTAARTVGYFHNGSSHYSHILTTWAPSSAASLPALDDLSDVTAPAPDDGDVLTWDDGTSRWVAAPPGAAGGGDATGYLAATFDGGGAVPMTGACGDVIAPYDGTITGWTILADQTGTATIDVMADTLGNFPPTGADAITGTAVPALSGADHVTSSTLTGWSPAITAGQVFRFCLISVSGCRRVSLILAYDRTP